MSSFRPLFPVPDGAGQGFVPLLEGGDDAPPMDDGSGFTPGFRPLVPGRMGAQFVSPTVEAVAGESDEPEPVQVVDEAAAEPIAEPAPEPEGAEEPVVEDVAMHRAHDEGFEMGRLEGLAAGEQELAAQLEQAQRLIAELDTLRREIFQRTVTDIAAAVRHIAQDVVHRELFIDSSGVEALVLDVLDHVQSDDEIVIHVAPEDEQLMQMSAPNLLNVLGRDAMVRIQSDPALSPGGVKIETQLGSIDASVETRFAAFAESVQEWGAEEASDARS